MAEFKIDVYCVSVVVSNYTIFRRINLTFNFRSGPRGKLNPKPNRLPARRSSGAWNKKKNKKRLNFKYLVSTIESFS